MRNLSKLANELLDIADELYARKHVCVSIHPEFNDISWEELCDKDMELLEEMKVG